IQILWHLIDLFKSLSKEEVRRRAAAIIPAIMVDGGHSSLDPLGTGAKGQGTLDLSETWDEQRKRIANVSPKFRIISDDTYDVVVGNPPYVRAHRRIMDTATEAAYAEVMYKQTDLYVFFIYRALTSWLKEKGRMGFIIPIAMLDAGYAGRV